MKYVLGIDGGGSKTYAVLVDELGNRLGTGLSGCGNHQGPGGVDTALTHIQSAADEALSRAGISYDDVDFVEYGLAGADREKDFNILRPALSRLPFKNWDVVCDTFEGLRAGTKDNVGVVLVCGSGTNAAGRNANGDTVQTGGFGYLFGDATGGHHLAVETFRSAVRSWEQRTKPSILEKLVAEHYGKHDMGEVYNHFLDHDIYHVSGELTVLLHQAANMGDEIAVSILEETGYELGIAANSVIRRLGLFDTTIPIVLVGTVVQKGKSKHLLYTLEKAVKKENPNVEMVIPEIAPVYGAVLLALDNLQIDVSDEVYHQFKQYGGYDE